MKWKTILIIIAFFALLVATFQIIGIGGGRLVTVEKDSKFTVSLYSSPATDYKWNANYDKEKVELVGINSASAQIGDQEVRNFVFKALEEGVAKIRFNYSVSKGDNGERKGDERLYKVLIK